MKIIVIILILVAAVYAGNIGDGAGYGLSGSYLPQFNVGDGSGIFPSGAINIGPGAGLHGIGGYTGNYQDQKHVYFFAAPDDEPAARLRINIAPASHRNTRIIFVKAPSYGGIIPEVIAPPSQTEDKTLVYVLVKKQQAGGAITIPSSLGVKQAKPEVYFVKYRNQVDAQQAVAGGLAGQVVGSGLSDLGSEGNFVRTLHVGGISGGGGIIGGSDHGGVSILGGSVGGNIRYGEPGASGPYKR